MELLKERIRKDGVFKPGGILKVDSFLNHQMDIDLINEIGREFARRFAGTKVTKILTIEASGIGIACIAAQYFHVPVVFAKKQEASNLSDGVYVSNVFSFTKNKNYTVRVDKKYIEAIKTYKENNLTQITKNAVDACVKRSIELENV